MLQVQEVKIQFYFIPDDEYTFYLYFRNESVPKKHIEMGLSPMHARILYMLSNFLYLYHECSMDNLLNSVQFSIASMNYFPNKVKY